MLIYTLKIYILYVLCVLNFAKTVARRARTNDSWLSSLMLYSMSHVWHNDKRFFFIISALKTNFSAGTLLILSELLILFYPE